MTHASSTEPAPIQDDHARPSLLARVFVVAWLVLLLPATSFSADLSSAQEQVFAAERAFAKSMADRKLDDFRAHVSNEAVFFGGSGVQRGKAEVVAAWSAFFDGPAAPFAWEPDQVEVLDSGTLALSTGLVRSPEGKVIGRFNSIWRLEAPGTWHVIFDKGSPPTAQDLEAAPVKP